MLGACIACVLAVAYREETSHQSRYQTKRAPITPYRTTATDLYANYSAFEAASRQEPPHVGIELSGVLTAVNRTMFAEPEIDLRAGPDSQIVALTLDKGQKSAADRLIAGESVTVRCDNMSRVLTQPTGQSCRLVYPERP